MEWVSGIATLIIVVLLPFFVNLCTTDAVSSNAKRWIVIIVSILVGLATGITVGLPTPETIVTWVLAVIGGVQLAYSAFKAIGLTNGWLEALQGVGVDSNKENN